MIDRNSGNQAHQGKRVIYSWAFYDWANSAFATTVMAGFFPVFFNNYWAASATEATVYLGYGNALASIIVAALAPFLGAIADKMSGKKKLLGFFAFLGIIMTGGLWLVAEGQWIPAIFLYVFGTVGFSGANVFYDSLLPGVASGKKADFVSSLGYSLGYIGGGLLFVINVLMFLFPASFGLPSDDGGATAIRLSFLTVAIWWAAFSVPIFIFVKEPLVEEKLGLGDAIRAGWEQLRDTLRNLKGLKVVGTFLLAYWFYIDGVDTIIKMAVDYGETIGFDSTDLIIALLITQFVAFPGTLLYNAFSRKIGVKRGVLVGIAVYCAITIGGYFMSEALHFYILAIAIGFVQGGIQALSRSLFSRIIPKNKAAQFFGFFNMLGKFAAILGPFLIGSVTLFTGNVRIAILSILALFVVGGLLLARVNIKEGERLASEYLEQA